MADFSEEYCKYHDFERKGDFNIWGEFDKLEEDTYISIICEGYGFIGIGKKKDESEPQLLFRFGTAIQEGYWNEGIPEGLNEEDCVWIKYNKLK